MSPSRESPFRHKVVYSVHDGCFSVLNAGWWVGAGWSGWHMQKLEETMHVLVRLLSPDSTFDLFQFLSKHFFPKFELSNSRCGLSASAAYTPVFTVSRYKTSSLNPQRKLNERKTVSCWTCMNISLDSLRHSNTFAKTYWELFMIQIYKLMRGNLDTIFN